MHDYHSEAVQRYIDGDIAKKFSGVEGYENVHPMNFGVNATYSHFPNSNIGTQGYNICESCIFRPLCLEFTSYPKWLLNYYSGSVLLFFVYHIGLCR